jgi:hypothetical protein
MPEFDRLSECIKWIDLSFVERKRTPEWAIQVGIRCHLAGMSLRGHCLVEYRLDGRLII